MNIHAMLRLICLLHLPVLACGVPAIAAPPTADINAYNTSVALTTAPLPVGGNTAVPAASDEDLLKQALASYLGVTVNDLQFTLTASNGSAAHGVVVPGGAMEGAAWFAAKDANGNWLILHTGQGWPLCNVIAPYNFPVEYVSYCEDANGNTIERAAGGSSAPPSAPTTAPTTQADSYAPDPLGVAWTGFWIALYECYDMDTMSAVSGTACDLKVGTNLFAPQNGALFEGALYSSAPSLNTCKSANLTSAAIDVYQSTYICFKTNAGKYGFFILRDIQADGAAFDAYLFP